MASEDSHAEHRTLSLISYNIQAGGTVSQYSHYVTKSWRQVLPNAERASSLASIGNVLAEYDIAGLQETDDGSLRTGFLNQTEYLAERAGYRFWSHQRNRAVSRFARTCNGLLSRIRPTDVHDHKLPGRVPGRGALAAYFDVGGAELLLVVAHLSLGRPSRQRQLDFISDVLESHPNAVVMGDMNTGAEAVELIRFAERAGLTLGSRNLPTFPSWRPQRAIDHIYVSGTIRILDSQVLQVRHSDHCPIAMRIAIDDRDSAPDPSSECGAAG